MLLSTVVNKIWACQKNIEDGQKNLNVVKIFFEPADEVLNT